MKLQISVFSLGMIAKVSANRETMLATMTAGLEEVMKGDNAAFRGVILPNNANEKEMPFFLDTYLQAIDGYGCWCNLEEEYYKGKGAPVNGIDGHCKALSLGYECIIMDGEESGSACNEPWAVGLYIPHNVALTPLGQTVAQQCTANNPADDCKIRSCIVEGTFVETVFADFLNTVVYDPNYKHGGGFFEPADDCTIVGGGGPQSERKCCGDYPFRYPFKTYNDQRKCCGQKTYNSDNHCCADENTNELALAGNC